MREQVNFYWNKFSRIGLREGEDVLQFREVILLNRLVTLYFFVMMVYVPVEIYFNGVELLPMVFVLMIQTYAVFVFHYFRLFRIASYYLYFSISIFIVTMGLMVGKGISNHVTLIPVVLLAMIMFKTNVERIILFLLTAALYLLQQKLFDVITPQFIVPVEIRPTFSVIFFLMALLLTFLIGFYFLGINREYEGIIVQKNKELEVKNKEITDSITYAKRIQTAILPPQRVVKEYLKDSFIFYLPKDVVAGDFYWFEPVENQVLFAAADCTGHGVPGAMLSVVCHNALNRAVHENKLRDPAKILEKTREIIINEFNKSDEEVKDGMDISLCALNTKSLELNWAGANNPLWIIRAGSEEVEEIKADKHPIGNHTETRSFTTHKVQLEKNDSIYVFTDGYMDQFGGEKGKKFKSANLKKLLVSKSNEPMSQQAETLKQVFSDWKGNLEQIDDVSIIGVRVTAG